MTYPGATLASTLLIQTLASLVLTAPSVLAPVVAPTLGFGPERVGLFVGTAYLAAMLSGLRSGSWVARIGAVRLSQIAMLCCALGALAGSGGQAPLLAVAALVIGVGYGVINPAASSLLARHAPLTRRGLFFSVKQTGVPLGVALSGLLLPWGLQTLGWRPSIVLAGGACLMAALLLGPLVRRLEPGLAKPRHAASAAMAAATTIAAASAAAPAPGASGAAAARGRAPLAERPPGLMSVLRDPALRTLSLTSFAFAFTQLCFITFLVSYLHLELGESLAAAAGVLAAAQVVSTVSRIGWGYVADRWIDPGHLLGALGLAMAAASVLLAFAGDTLGRAMVVTAAVLCAITTMGWNGVFFAELARRATRGEMAALAGASQFFTFSGSMAGPIVFGEIIRRGGSYSLAYLILALLPAVAGLVMLRAASRESAGN
jgi:MFS family permease